MNKFRTAFIACLLLAFFIGCSGTSKNQSVTSANRKLHEKTEKKSQPKHYHPDDIFTSPSDDLPDDPKSQAIVKQALAYCKKSQSCWQKRDLEEALGALDKAYSLILELNDEDDAEMAKRKEDLRYLISKRILEIYASQRTSAKGHHRAIPLEMNRHVQAEIDYLMRGEFFKNAYMRSGRYRAHITEELTKAGLPTELAWLPLIESGYNVRALSTARALGLWQFIPSTGYRFGLNRDQYIDERMDPYKSTQAAIGYLKALHDLFGDWSTVLAAYNCGEGRVLDVIRSQQINYLDNFWDLYERLPNETARYVPRFLATLHIIGNPKKYGIDNIRPYDPIDFEVVSVSKQVSLNGISEQIAVPPEILKELNPELRQGILPHTGYSLRIPQGKESVLLAKLDEIPVVELPRHTRPVRIARTHRADRHSRNNKAAPPAVVFHRVERGDTLSSIARAYDTDIATIKKANRIKKGNTIPLGKVLKIPGAKAVRLAETKAAPKRTQPRAATKYVVKQGDTLWSIARRHNTSPQSIMAANGMKGQSVHAGKSLKIPSEGAVESGKARAKSQPEKKESIKVAAVKKGADKSAPSKSAGKTASKKRSSSTQMAANDAVKTYRVKNGDAPMDIARRHNMTLKRFLDVNNLTSKSKIFPGQKVAVE